jgi:DNA primase
MIERAVIEEIVGRTDIHNLISSYVTLQRAASVYKGLCPFHSERTPSFTVYPSNGSFYCFGCGAGGNAITFVKKAENLDFEDAVEFLAKRAGITVKRDARDDGGRRYDRSKLFNMNRDAAKFFHANLYENDPGSQLALKYLREKRGLSNSTIKHFGLGYAPSNGNLFYKYMRSKGYTDDELVVGFLCAKSERNGSVFSAFRNRVMFPIIDVSGNVIAFGGRVMDDSQPKYKNSSDTPVYKKSKNLFALNYARQSCAESMILCEGYLDVIALHASGFTNAVATLGTAITPEQARLMSRYTKKIYISYDSDEAGQKAASKALAMLEEVGLEVRVLKMQGAKDPDEFIKTFGADSFQKLLAGSSTKFDFNMDKVLSKYNISIPQDRIDACSELCKVIARVYSSAEREVYIAELSKRLEIDIRSIKSDVEKNIRKNLKESEKKELQRMHQAAGGLFDRVNPEFIKSPSLARAEESVLGMLLLYPDIRSFVFDKSGITLAEEDFYTEFGRKIFKFVFQNSDKGALDESQIDNYFSADEVGRITQMKISRMTLENNDIKVFEEIANRMKTMVSQKKSQDSASSLEDLTEIINKKRKLLDGNSD